jgi:hypothetical protein
MSIRVHLWPNLREPERSWDIAVQHGEDANKEELAAKARKDRKEKTT